MLTSLTKSVHTACIKKVIRNTVVGDDGKLTVEYALDKRRQKTCVTNVENCNLQEGDIRLVKWSDGKYYQARILKIGKLYNVSYEKRNW